MCLLWQTSACGCSGSPHLGETFSHGPRLRVRQAHDAWFAGSRYLGGEHARAGKKGTPWFLAVLGRHWARPSGHETFGWEGRFAAFHSSASTSTQRGIAWIHFHTIIRIAKYPWYRNASRQWIAHEMHQLPSPPHSERLRQQAHPIQQVTKNLANQKRNAEPCGPALLLLRRTTSHASAS